jgi:hypothetical protein
MIRTAMARGQPKQTMKSVVSAAPLRAAQSFICAAAYARVRSGGMLPALLVLKTKLGVVEWLLLLSSKGNDIDN